MKFEAKNLSPVAFHALTCAEVSVSIQCFDWSKMAAEGFPVARIDEYAKPCEPAIHLLRSVADSRAFTARYSRFALVAYFSRTVLLKPSLRQRLAQTLKERDGHSILSSLMDKCDPDHPATSAMSLTLTLAL